MLPGFDARFPNQNQTKHCWQNYVDYHKCILAKGEDFAPCRQVRKNMKWWYSEVLNGLQFFLAYKSLCPSAWCERWDDQRGKFLKSLTKRLQLLISHCRGRDIPNSPRPVNIRWVETRRRCNGGNVWCTSHGFCTIRTIPKLIDRPSYWDTAERDALREDSWLLNAKSQVKFQAS